MKNILKESFFFTWHHKWLWILGLFATLLNSIDGIFTPVKLLFAIPEFSAFSWLFFLNREKTIVFFQNILLDSGMEFKFFFVAILFGLVLSQTMILLRLRNAFSETSKNASRDSWPQAFGKTLGINVIFYSVSALTLLAVAILVEWASSRYAQILLLLGLISWLVFFSYIILFAFIFSVVKNYPFIASWKLAAIFFKKQFAQTLSFSILLAFVKIFLFAAITVSTVIVILPLSVLYFFAAGIELVFVTNLLTKLGFLLVVCVGALFFGAWTVWEYCAWNLFVKHHLLSDKP